MRSRNHKMLPAHGFSDGRKPWTCQPPLYLMPLLWKFWINEAKWEQWNGHYDLCIPFEFYSLSLSLSRAPVLNVFIWHFFWPWSCSWSTDRMMNLMNACKQWPKICDDEIKPFPRLTVGQVIQCERTAGKKSYKEEVVKYFRHRWDNILDKHSVHAPTKCERRNA